MHLHNLKKTDAGKDIHEVIIKKEKRENSMTKSYWVLAVSSSCSLCQGSEKLPEACICVSQETARLGSSYGKQLYLQPEAVAISHSSVLKQFKEFIP